MQYQQPNGKFVTFDGADGPKLYFCDPEKNTRCSKESCGKECFHTTVEEFGLFVPEKPKASDIYTKKEFEEKMSEILKRKDSPCGNCADSLHCISGTTCRTYQAWFRGLLYPAGKMPSYKKEKKNENHFCKECTHFTEGYCYRDPDILRLMFRGAIACNEFEKKEKNK